MLAVLRCYASGRGGGSGDLHNEGAVAGLGEEVVVAWVLVARAANELRGWDGGWGALAADGELEVERGEVEVTAWCAGGVEGMHYGEERRDWDEVAGHREEI